MKILTIDGGGIRGYYSALILKGIQDRLSNVFYKDFQLIVGSSTGSIIASALALDIPLERLIRLYEQDSKNIFKKSVLKRVLTRFLCSDFSINTLREVLIKNFGDAKLSDAKTVLLIPATNIIDRATRVFFSDHLLRLDEDAKCTPCSQLSVVDVILASSAAPTYFDPVKINGELFADGGLWANNPSLLAITEAILKFKAKVEDIKLLSIGTGIHKINSNYDINQKNWGLIFGWGTKKFINMLFEIQSFHSENETKLLLSNEHYLRVNFHQPREITLDDVRSLPFLKEQAARDLDKFWPKIELFMAQ